MLSSFSSPCWAGVPSGKNGFSPPEAYRSVPQPVRQITQTPRAVVERLVRARRAVQNRFSEDPVVLRKEPAVARRLKISGIWFINFVADTRSIRSMTAITLFLLVDEPLADDRVNATIHPTIRTLLPIAIWMCVSRLFSAFARARVVCIAELHIPIVP